MIIPNRKTVERICKIYPTGTRVELVMMDDTQAPPIVALGTVLACSGITAAVLMLAMALIKSK